VLGAAQGGGDFFVTGVGGTTAAQDAQHAGMRRAYVRADVVAGRRSGDYIFNAELGTTARQL
jgi:hypothetical protein